MTRRLDEYIDQKGIVVPFPETIELKIEALLDYIETIENDCETAEVLGKALERENNRLGIELTSYQNKLLNTITWIWSSCPENNEHPPRD